jgi:hypothetical protein
MHKLAELIQRGPVTAKRIRAAGMAATNELLNCHIDAHIGVLLGVG